MSGDSNRLTAGESRIVELVAAGLKNREVARQVGLTEGTVKFYLKRIYDKLGVWNRIELALWYEAHNSSQV